jgi:hypothetical protein
MDAIDLFNIMGTMLATGPITLADLIVGLVAWTATGVLFLALPVVRKVVNKPVSQEKASKTAA